jgi:hypothetical protein
MRSSAAQRPTLARVSHWLRMFRRWALLLGISVGLSACYGQIEAPPRPTAIRIPTIVGELAGIEQDNATYRLRDGTRVTIGSRWDGASPTATQLSDRSLWLPAPPKGGGLLLYGEDAAGRFWASTEPDDGSGCFALHGQGYLEDVGVHLSSGLVLTFAPGGTVRNPRAANQTDPSWILSFDIICLNRDGQVTLLNHLPLGA